MIFFEKSVVEISTSNSTAKKHKYAIQKYLDVIEQKEITLKDNLKIKLSLNTQLERKKQLAISKRHATDAHSKIPLKCLSINNENKLLQVTWECYKHGMSMLDSLLFLSIWNICVATFLRFDILHSTCFEDIYYHEDEGPHHLKTEDRVK